MGLWYQRGQWHWHPGQEHKGAPCSSPVKRSWGAPDWQSQEPGFCTAQACAEPQAERMLARALNRPARWAPALLYRGPLERHLPSVNPRQPGTHHTQGCFIFILNRQKRIDKQKIMFWWSLKALLCEHTALKCSSIQNTVHRHQFRESISTTFRGDRQQGHFGSVH